jgi:hypothetical protein
MVPFSTKSDKRKALTLYPTGPFLQVETTAKGRIEVRRLLVKEP